MDSRMKTLVLAAIVASIAVLAVLPADDVSADTSVSYVGTYTIDGSDYTELSVSLDTAAIVISVAVGDDYIGYGYSSGGSVSFPSIYTVNRADNTAAVIPDGPYTCVVTDLRTGSQLYSGSITIGVPSYAVDVVQPDVGGTISASPLSAAQGATVELSNTPADGYEFVSYSVKDANNEDVAVADGKFTMPASNVTVTATFEQTVVPGEQYAITYGQAQNGSVTGPAQAAEGAEVTPTVTSATGYELDALTVVAADQTAVTVTDGSFTMPAQAVTVSATFKESTTPANGIAIGDVQYETVAKALAAAKSGDVVTVTKDVKESGTLAIPEGVSIHVAKGATFDAKVSYDGSVVSVKVSSESDITIGTGSITITGTVSGKDVYDVSAGTLEISALTVEDGGILQIETEGDAVVVLKDDDASQITLDEGAIYRGPAFTVGGTSDGELIGIPYTNDSRIVYNGVTYMIHVFVSGTTDTLTVSAGFGYYETSYTGDDITLNQIRAMQLNWSYRVFYASDGGTYYAVPNGATIQENDLTIGIVTVDDVAVSQIVDPGIYDKAYNVYAGIQDVNGNAVGQATWVNYGLIIDPVSTKDLTASTDESFVYDGKQKEIDLSKVVVKDKSGNVIALDLSGSEVTYPVDPIDVGTYTAVIAFPGAGVYDAGEFNVTFKITKAPNTMALIPSEATWSSEKYNAGDVKYSLGDPEADGTVTITASVVLAGGTTVLKLGENENTITITYADDKDAFQAALDDLIASITAEKYGQQVDDGYTLTLVLKSENGKNVEDGQVTGTYTVTAYTQEKIRLVFTTGTDGVTVEQKDTQVTVSGQVAVVDGKAVFQVNVSSPDTSLVTEKDVRGYTVVTLNGAASESAVFTATENGAYITFTLSQPATDKYDAQAYAAKPTDSRYYDSDPYSLDLSGLKLTAATFRGIILEKDGDYTDVIYTQNQVYDLTGGEELTDNVKFYLPASNTGSYWTLTIDGVAKEKASVYKAGTVYLVQSADRSLDGLIHFVATAATEPEAAHTIVINAVGYAAENPDEVLNAALKDAGYTGEPVSDGIRDVMYVVYTSNFAGPLTLTLNGQVLSTEIANKTAGVHYIEWSFRDVEGTNTFDDRTQYNVVLTENADSSVTASVAFAVSEKQPEAAQTVEINAVGYVTEGGNAAINAALQAAGYTGEAVADADGADIMYVVFTASFDGAVTVTLNNEVLGTLKDSWSAGVHAVYWHDSDAATYTAGTTAKITIAQATDSTVSDTVSYVFSGNVAPAPSTETSTNVKAALRTDDTGVYLMLIAADDKIIPSGTVTVTYSYMGVDPSNPFGGESLLSDTFTIDYQSTGKAYAYITVDFTADASAAAVYSDIVGASAVFSDGTTSYSANMVSFTLPARA